VDKALAAHWYAKAAAQHQAAAQYNWGVMRWRGRAQDPEAVEQARIQWEAAADTGMASAQFALGLLGPPNAESGRLQALEYFDLAAQQGHLQALFNLANGLRLAGLDAQTPDAAALTRSAQAYERAAQQGDVLAMYMLARAHWYGEGLPHSADQALYWYTRAADDGDAGAQFCLGYMYANGQGVPKDYAQAARWYLAAAGVPASPPPAPSPPPQPQEVGLTADVQG
jgi:hypothetical protein